MLKGILSKNDNKHILFIFYVFFIQIFLSLFSCHSTESVTVISINHDYNPEWITQSVDEANVNQVIFYSNAVKKNVSFHIYLPEEYYSETSRKLPVLYWLHGTGDGTLAIPFLSDYFNQAIKSGLITPMIIIFPNSTPIGMWCNSKNGNIPIESMFIDDLIPYIVNNYRTINTANGRIIEGFSMGGYGAARLGIKYHEKIAGISILGSEPLQPDFTTGPNQNIETRKRVFDVIYGNDLEYFVAQSPWYLSEKFSNTLTTNILIRQILGTLDFTLSDNRNFHNHLITLGINHQYQEIEDIEHSAKDLLPALGVSNWGFYNTIFNP